MEPHEYRYVVQICTNFRADLDIGHASVENSQVLFVVSGHVVTTWSVHTSAENKADCGEGFISIF